MATQVQLEDRHFPTDGLEFYVGTDGGELTGHRGVSLGRVRGKTGMHVIQRDDGTTFVCGGAYLNRVGRPEVHCLAEVE